MSTKHIETIDAIVSRIIDPLYNSRFDRPYLDGGQLMATDGRIMVVFSDPSQYAGSFYAVKDGRLMRDSGSSIRAANWRSVVSPPQPITKWHDVPAVEGPPEGANDLWQVMEDCDCLGGRCVCSCCESDHECGKCEGEGEILEAVSEASERIEFGDRDIGRRLAWIMSLLPGVKWGVAVDSPHAPVYFVFDGGQGVVMPLRKD